MFYEPLDVEVSLDYGETITCRTYISKEKGYKVLPSKSYLKTIVKGAVESKLPEYYINQLRKIEHNGNVEENRERELRLDNFEL